MLGGSLIAPAEEVHVGVGAHHIAVYLLLHLPILQQSEQLKVRLLVASGSDAGVAL